jgi:DNA polymerase-3 subunit gamma/tau
VSYEPLHHKYRPQTFADLVGQEAIAQTLINAIRTERIAPAYLFSGPRGTGKTSSARILAKSLNCLQQKRPTEKPCGQCEVCKSIAAGNALDVIEIDAASNTGVDNIRELIEKAQFAPVQCRYKVYVVDECHMLSVAAFNALLKTLEEPPARVVFVLATTDPQRVLPTIISRCQKFDFRRIPLGAMVQHLQHIAANENIDITPEALTLVAQVAQGGLRDAESLLDQLGLVGEQVTVERVWDLVGAVPERDLMALTQAIADDNPQAVLDHCRHLMDRGREPLIVLQNLAGFYRDLLIAKTAPNRNDLVAVTLPTWTQLCEFTQDVDLSLILQGQQHLKNSEAQIKNTTQPRLWLEVTLLGLLPSAYSSQPPHPQPAVHPQQSKTKTSHPTSPSISRSPQETNVPPAASHPSPPPEASKPQPSPSPSGTDITKPSPLSTSEGATAAPHPTDSQVPKDENPSSQNLEETWQRVLDAIQPMAAQALLRQHSHLVSFEGSIARVGISSVPLLELAQKKLPNIEAAFAAVYQSNVKVSLFTQSSKSPNTRATEQSAPSRVTSSPPPIPVTPSVSHEPPPPTPTVSQKVPVLQEEATPAYTNGGRNGERSNILQAEKPVTSTLERQEVEPITPVSLSSNESSVALAIEDYAIDVEDIQKALNNLEQFFEGEIVEIDSQELGYIPPRESNQSIDEFDEPLGAWDRELEDEGDKIEPVEIEPVTSYQWQASELSALEDPEVKKRLENIECDEDGDIPF